jgi:alpha-ketoglutarate-dependent taurine dioxygenase
LKHVPHESQASSTCFPAIDQLSERTGLAARVLKDGWIKSTVAEMNLDPRAAAANVANMLGDPFTGRAGQKAEPLMPTTRSGARAKSLSFVYGLGSIPMHTDGAHLVQPPRFIVLVCASPGSSPVPTTVFRFRDLHVTCSERARFEAAPFLVRNGRKSFYSTICSPGRPFIRFDKGCMVPLGPDGAASVKVIADRAREIGFTTVHWQTGDVIIIDNWNVLHGRGHSDDEASTDRMLLRVSVK